MDWELNIGFGHKSFPITGSKKCGGSWSKYSQFSAICNSYVFKSHHKHRIKNTETMPPGEIQG